MRHIVPRVADARGCRTPMDSLYSLNFARQLTPPRFRTKGAKQPTMLASLNSTAGLGDCEQQSPDIDHTRPKSMSTVPEVTLISLESIIGAGKSTQLDQLKRIYAGNQNVVFIDEPVDEWESYGFVDAMYDRALNSSLFQMIALVSRVTKITDAILAGARFVISERSPWSDYIVFAGANLHGIELTAYRYAFANMQRVLEKHAKLSFAMVYLEVDAQEATTRMNKRGRESEVGKTSLGDEDRVPIEYQELLQRKHEELLMTIAHFNLASQVMAHAGLPCDPDRKHRMISQSYTVDGMQDKAQITEDLKDIVDAQLARVNPKACCDAAEKAACVLTTGQEFCVA